MRNRRVSVNHIDIIKLLESLNIVSLLRWVIYRRSTRGASTPRIQFHDYEKYNKLPPWLFQLDEQFCLYISGVKKSWFWVRRCRPLWILYGFLNERCGEMTMDSSGRNEGKASIDGVDGIDGKDG